MRETRRQRFIESHLTQTIIRVLVVFGVGAIMGDGKPAVRTPPFIAPAIIHSLMSSCLQAAELACCLLAPNDYTSPAVLPHAMEASKHVATVILTARSPRFASDSILVFCDVVHH